MQDLPRPGMEPVPPVVEAQNLNHWTAREVLGFFLMSKKTRARKQLKQ